MNEIAQTTSLFSDTQGGEVGVVSFQNEAITYCVKEGRVRILYPADIALSDALLEAINDDYEMHKGAGHSPG